MRYTQADEHGTFSELRASWSLSHFDEHDLAACRDYILTLGYDDATVAKVGSPDSGEDADIVSICRRGEPWATWMFARNGDAISAWSALTGEDAGTFLSLSEAVRSVLLSDPLRRLPPRAD